jgi:hypothetical protein
MDGISEDQLWIERLSEVELSDIHLEYLKESVDAGFYPGKTESFHWKMLQALGAELRVRMAAL